MSLIGTLNLAGSSLAVQQAALQVTGNNISNAGNADYTRQVATTTPQPDQQIQPGMFVGTGVNLTAVQRQIDDALQSRIQSGISDNDAANSSAQWLGQVQATFNELSSDDLSTQLSTFFSSWSDLANKPQDSGLRQVVIQNGQNVADFFQNLRGQLSTLQGTVQQQLTSQTSAADALAQQVADLNSQITVAEGGTGGTANSLRDQRDTVLGQLAKLVNIKTVPDQNGSVVNVYVGSEPLVNGTTNRGLTVTNKIVNGQNVSTVVSKADNGTVPITSGELGALSTVQQQISGVVSNVDSLAGNMIFELNKLHSSGQGLEGFSSTTATNPVADTTIALNDPTSGLKFAPSNGSFVVHVTNKTTGLSTSTLVKVDLDGLNSNDTTLDSLTADLNGVAGVTATDTSGVLKISAANSDDQISFSQDSSGTLAALGINSFYQGTDASNIAVNQAIEGDPSLLAAAKNGEPADNQTALAIANLQSQPLTGLNGATLTDSYETMVNTVATSASGAQTNAQATQTVLDTLQAQRESLSGVSLDEEAVNLIKQQRAFQASARVITVVNEMMDDLLGLVK